MVGKRRNSLVVGRVRRIDRRNAGNNGSDAEVLLEKHKIEEMKGQGADGTVFYHG